MLARVSSLSIPPERMEEAARHIVEEAVPAARALPGLTRTSWLSDVASGTLVTVSVYGTEADLVGNSEVAGAIRGKAAASAGGSVDAVQQFQVIAELSAEEEGKMENKALARRIYDEVLNGRDLDLLTELVRPDYIEHDPLPGQREGLEGIRDRYRMLIDGLDPHFTIEDLIAEGERVVVRWTNSGTNVGPFLGAPATNRPFRTAGIDIYRVQDGKLAEHWHVVDVYGQMVQLGLLPAPQGT